jgi:hypothetical protein
MENDPEIGVQAVRAARHGEPERRSQARSLWKGCHAAWREPS